MEVVETIKKPKPKFDKDKLYHTEQELRKEMGDVYNNIMNHRMKDKNTCKMIMPTYGLFSEEVIYKTTNQEKVFTSFNDPYLDKKHHITTDLYKRYNEEMFKTRNIKAKLAENQKTK